MQLSVWGGFDFDPTRENDVVNVNLRGYILSTFYTYNFTTFHFLQSHVAISGPCPFQAEEF